MRTILLIILSFASYLIIVPLRAIDFVHPGIHNTIEELEYIKDKIDNNEEPWKSTFEGMQIGNYPKFSGAQNINYTPTPHADVGTDGDKRQNLSEDGRACHIQALLWYFTEDSTYAKNAIALLEAWGSTLEASDKPLAAGTTIATFCMGAELVKYTYPGWDSDDDLMLDQFIETMYDVLLDEIWPQPSNPRGNHWTLATNGIVALAILNEDEDLFLKGLKRANELIQLHIDEDGINSEVCRDINAHSNMQNSGHTLTAQLLWVQGYDFFSAHGNRVLLASEYNAQIYNLESTNASDYTPKPNCDVINAPKFTEGTGSHLAYYHAKNILNMSVPELEEHVLIKRPFSGYRDGNGMGDFLHRSKGAVYGGGGKVIPDLTAVGPDAHWNFNSIQDGQQSIPSTSGSLTLDLSDWNAADIAVNSGFRTNILFGDENGDSLELANRRNNGNHIDINFSMEGRHFLAITYGAKGFSHTTKFPTLTWSYSIDGQTFTPVETIKTLSSNTKEVIRMSDMTELNDQPNVTVRLTIKNLVSDNSRLIIDNLQIESLAATFTTSQPPELSDPIFAQEDTYVRGGTYESHNFGINSELLCKSNGEGSSLSRESFIKFDLGSAPSNIDRAYLRLTANNATDDSGALNQLLSVADNSWSELDLIWINKPDTYNEIDSWTPQDNTRIEIDVTTEVLAAMSNDNIISFALIANGNHLSRYASREDADEAKRPQLVFSLAPDTAYSLWTANFPNLLDTDSDFENDGLETKIEWVLGGNPTLNDGASIMPQIDNSDPYNFLFSFRRTDDAKADDYTIIRIEYGTNLINWRNNVDHGSSDGVTITETNDFYDNGIDKVTVAIPRILATDGTLFTRLSVLVSDDS